MFSQLARNSVLMERIKVLTRWYENDNFNGNHQAMIEQENELL